MIKIVQRNEYFDILKGIAIIFVIGIHTYKLTGCYSDIWNSFGLIIRQIIVLAVPLFCALSGYFSHSKCQSECMKFTKQKSPWLYIPALLWSIPYLAYDIYRGMWGGQQIANFFLLGYSRHYFILVMLQFYLLMPLILRTAKSKYLLLVSLIISLMTIGYFSHRMYIKDIDTPLVIYAGSIFVWIAFFCLGIYMGNINRKYKLRIWVMCMVASLVLSYVESIYYIDVYQNLGGIGYKVSNFIFSFFAIIVLFSEKLENYVKNYKDNLFCRFFRWCGCNSLGLFFVHSPLLFFVFSHVNIGNTWLVKFGVCLAISSIVVYYSKQIFSKSLLKYIGFR